MQLCPSGEDELDPRIYSFYCAALRVLQEAQVPFLVGGAYALARHTGIVRHTKDLDVFARPADCERVLQVLSAAGQLSSEAVRLRSEMDTFIASIRTA